MVESMDGDTNTIQPVLHEVADNGTAAPNPMDTHEPSKHQAKGLSVSNETIHSETIPEEKKSDAGESYTVVVAAASGTKHDAPMSQSTNSSQPVQDRLRPIGVAESRGTKRAAESTVFKEEYPPKRSKDDVPKSSEEKSDPMIPTESAAKSSSPKEDAASSSNQDTSPAPSAPGPSSKSNEVGNGGVYSKIQPELAERAKFEDMGQVVPLPPLTLRDIAELEHALQIGDKNNYGPESGWETDWGGTLHLFDRVCQCYSLY